MKKWIDDYISFWKNKYYVLCLSLSALLGYGYLVTHHTIGIDDTPAVYYFEEGLAAIVGRWVMFLVNKVVNIAQPFPFVTDLMGILIFMAGVTVWSVLMKRIFTAQIPDYGYVLFACLLLTNSLHGEVFTYYLHNGVATGYLFIGLSLCCFQEGVESWGKSVLTIWKPMALSLICLWIAMGCYESFMIVYLVGVCILLCCNLMSGRLQNKIFRYLCAAAVIAAAGMVLRSLTVAGITVIFGLEELREEAVHRSLTEMAGWMTDPENAGLLGMILKRIYVMYCVFGYAYYPVRIYVFACVMIGVVCIWMSVRRKTVWISLLGVGSFVASYLLVFIEGKATLYRAAQFLPLVSAWGLLLVVFAVTGMAAGFQKKFSDKLQGVATGKLVQMMHILTAVVLAVILWNQCTDLNHWFYVDDMKYQAAMETVSQVAYELEKNFDTSKPVAFTGSYLVPKGIIEDAFVAINAKNHYKMAALTNPIDEYLLSKYYREYGIWVAQTPSLSVIDWGKDAFGNGEELAKFFRMHGHEVYALKDEALLEEAATVGLTMPKFPAEGAIVDVGEYIVVNF